MSGTSAMVETALQAAKDNGPGYAALLMALLIGAWQLITDQKSDYNRFESRLERLEHKVEARVGDLASTVRDIEKVEIAMEGTLAGISREISRMTTSLTSLRAEVRQTHQDLTRVDHEGDALRWRIASLERRTGNPPPSIGSPRSLMDGPSPR